jgi:hypothetical protein
MPKVQSHPSRSVLLAAFVAVPLLTTGCRLFQGDSGDPAELRSVSEPAAVPTVAAWDALPAEVRVDILTGAYAKYPNMKVTERQAPAAFSDPAQRAYAEKLATYLKTNGDMEVVDSIHARVGELKVTARLLLLDGTTTLGGEVGFWHQGCDMPDDTTPQFKSAADAEAAGCDLGESSYWAAHGTFNHDGVPFEYSDFLEWGAPL